MNWIIYYLILLSANGISTFTYGYFSIKIFALYDYFLIFSYNFYILSSSLHISIHFYSCLVISFKSGADGTKVYILIILSPGSKSICPA